MKTFLFILFVIKCTSGLYERTSKVIELTPSNFDRLVIDSDEIWLVEFFAPWCGHCQSLVPEYLKVAEALKGVVKVGAVNADEHKTLGGKYGVKGFPTIKIFGANKQSPKDYNKERTAKAITDAVLSEIENKIKSSLNGKGEKSHSNNVIELTDSNFNKLVLNSNDIWMVEFFAPWCGHCKALAPEWKKAATEMKGKVKFGALDATIHTSIAQEYNVNGYPTIKMFPAGRKTSNDALDYVGGRKAADIVEWLKDKYENSLPAPKLYEITSPDVLKENCEGKPLCIIAALPHILDCNAVCRNNYLGILQRMGEKFKRNQWGWLWAEAQAQIKLEEALEIGGFGYPAMAAVSFKKMKFSMFKGSFSDEGVYEFLGDISYGRGQTSSLRGTQLPDINTIQPWDGKDGQPPETEDIDLSDIYLDGKDEL